MNYDLTKGIAILERTPNVVRAMLAGLPEEWTHRDEGPDTWSAFDIVGHLVDGEETDWMARARIILSGDAERRFEPFDRFRHLQRSEGVRHSHARAVAGDVGGARPRPRRPDRPRHGPAIPRSGGTLGGLPARADALNPVS